VYNKYCISAFFFQDATIFASQPLGLGCRERGLFERLRPFSCKSHFFIVSALEGMQTFVTRTRSSIYGNNFAFPVLVLQLLCGKINHISPNNKARVQSRK